MPNSAKADTQLRSPPTIDILVLLAQARDACWGEIETRDSKAAKLFLEMAVVNARNEGRAFSAEYVVTYFESVAPGIRAQVDWITEDPDALEAFYDLHATFDWLISRISMLTGLSANDIRGAVDRITRGKPLDSEYFEPQDLNNVCRILHKLDEDGQNNWFWHQARRRSTLLRKASGDAGPKPAATKAENPVNKTVGGKKKPRMTREQANSKAMELAQKMGLGFFALSIRGQARMIGCACPTWKSTQFFQIAEKKRFAPHGGKSPQKAAESFTKTREATTGQGRKDEVFEIAVEREEELRRLVAEQNSELKMEPSPLECDHSGRPRRVYSPKRL